jgi:hypothetical protein
MNNIRSKPQLLVTGYALPSSMIISTVMMETIRSSKTFVPTKPKRRHIPEDVILHSHPP